MYLAALDKLGMHAINRAPMSSLRRPAERALDGPWDFQLRSHPEAAEGESWTPVNVPDLWTMRPDSGDHPHYTNVPMPFPCIYPTVPTSNPTGVYRRTVRLDPLAPGHRLFIHVGAAEGYLTVTVNGDVVGTSTDSHLAAEFDISDAARPGTNLIELVVVKWSALTYLEDQDQWWHGGLPRSIYLFLVPEVRLADVVAVADFEPQSGQGSLRLEVVTSGLRGQPDRDGHKVRIHLQDHSETAPVAPQFPPPTMPKPTRDRSVQPPQTLPDDYMDIISMSAAAVPLPPEWRANPDAIWWQAPDDAPPGTATFELTGLDVSPWSAETPHLETVQVELLDPYGHVIDTTSLRIGFRRVEIIDGELRVNGRPILIQGVNRHDHDPHTGRVVSRERMIAELSLLKQFNVNAIRTSHYPNDPTFLELCDEFGFYVVDEADIESHAFASTLASDPLYLSAITERVARMIIRDRNHPSVIIWSLGNESGYHSVHDAAAAWARGTDPTRPVQYEGAVAGDWYGGRAASDIVAPMYPSWASLEAYAAHPQGDRPLILCEYAYSQGNSTGGIDRYWRLFESLPGLQGGFIWQFTDHALDPDRSGEGRYGGDFGDEPNNGATLLNGLAFADLTPKPAFYEVRSIFSPIKITSDAEQVRGGSLGLKNRQIFAGLDDFEVTVHVETTKGATAAMSLSLPEISAGSEHDCLLPEEIVQRLSSDEVLSLTVTVRTARKQAWAASGTEIAVHGVTLRQPTWRLPRPRTAAKPNRAGEPVHPILSQAPRLCLWRALTDNDLSAPLDQRFVRAGYFSLTAIDTTITAQTDRTVVVTTYQTAFGDQVVHRRYLSVGEANSFVFDEHVTLPDGPQDLLRVGVVFELAAGFDTVDWIGLGPWENYADRRSAATLARWSSPISAMAVPYLRPQENGTRSGVTWLEVAGARARVQVIPDRPVYINVSRIPVNDLEARDHWWELTPRDTTIIHIDLAHRGVGTGRIGPDTAPEFRITDRHYEWRWGLRLLTETDVA